MTIPNLGVTQIIPQQGPLGIAAQGLGGLGQLMMQVEQAKQEKAKNDAYNAYMGELTTASRTGRESSAAAAAAAKRDAEARAEAYGQVLEGLGANGALQPGEIAALRLMDPTEGTKKVLEMFGPMKLGGTERLVNPRGGDGGAPVVTMGVDTTPPPVTRPGDVAEAIEVVLGLPRDTPIGDLTPDQRGELDRYINRKVATGADRTIINNAANTLAGKLAELGAAGLSEERQVAVSSVQDIVAIDDALDILDGPGAFTGKFAPLQQKATEYLEALGVPRDPRTTAMQQLAVITGRRTLAILGSGALGAGTAVSDRDAERADALSGAKFDNTPRAYREIFDLARRNALATQQMYNRRVDGLPEELMPPGGRDLLRVEIPMTSPRRTPTGERVTTSGRPATTTRETYLYRGVRYPVIVGSDGARYIYTPQGPARVP